MPCAVRSLPSSSQLRALPSLPAGEAERCRAPPPPPALPPAPLPPLLLPPPPLLLPTRLTRLPLCLLLPPLRHHVHGLHHVHELSRGARARVDGGTKGNIYIIFSVAKYVH